MCFFGGSTPQPQNKATQQAAQNVRSDEDARQSRLSSGLSSINSAFSQYDDPSYSSGLQSDYLNYYNPQVDQQYNDSKQQLLFNNARSGNLDSSAGAKSSADLEREVGQQRAAIQSGANNYVNTAKSELAQQKSDLVNQLYATGGDSVSGSLASQVAPPTLPQFSPLGSLFANVAGVAANDARIASLKNGYSTGLLNPQLPQVSQTPSATVQQY